MSTIPHILNYIVTPFQLLEGMYFFLAVIAVILLFITIYMIRRARRSAARQRLKRQFAEFISYLAICDDEAECLEHVQQPGNAKRVASWLKEPFARQTLIRELVNTVKNMSGQAAINMSWFYTHTGLDKDSLARLKSPHWHIKSRAIQQLAQLQQKQYVTKIYRLTNDKHELVRNEARVAVVKLTGFEGLRFLDVITYPITEWQQICLLQELAQQENQQFPSIEKWLRAENSSVVEFALRLVSAYHLYDTHDSVVNALSSPDSDVRCKAVLALKEIPATTTTSALIAVYHQQAEANQRTILEVIRDIGSETDIPFLATQLQHPVADIKAAAARAIRDLQSEGVQKVRERVDTASWPWTIIIPQLQQEVAV